MAEAFAVDMVMALLRGIAGQTGAHIFQEIFPASVPTYFGQVYKEIEKIVDNKLTEHKIRELNGKINGLRNYVVNTYTPLKETGKLSKAELFDKISSVQASFVTDVIGVLESYRDPGMGAYMIAAGMNLCLLQEMALLIDDEQKSALKENAATHIKHAQTTYDHLIKSRREKIKLTSRSKSASWMVTHYFGWKDTVTREDKEWSYYGCPSGVHGDRDAEELAKEGKKSHEKKTISKLIKDLGDPQKVIDLWKKLITNPLTGVGGDREAEELAKEGTITKIKEMSKLIRTFWLNESN